MTLFKGYSLGTGVTTNTLAEDSKQCLATEDGEKLYIIGNALEKRFIGRTEVQNLSGTLLQNWIARNSALVQSTPGPHLEPLLMGSP